MAIGVKLPALLSKSQLDHFRSEIMKRQEAVFLAPQLLEQVAILSRHLRVALGQLEAARGTLSDIDSSFAALARSGGDCPSCHGAELRAALQQLREALGQE